jgi:hypothetical protein
MLSTCTFYSSTLHRRVAVISPYCILTSVFVPLKISSGVSNLLACEQIAHFRANCSRSSKLLTSEQIAHFRANCSLSSKLLTFEQIAHFRANCSRSSKLLTSEQIAHFRANCSLSSKLLTFEQIAQGICCRYFFLEKGVFPRRCSSQPSHIIISV